MAGRFPLIAHFLGQARKYFFALVFGRGSAGVPMGPMVGVGMKLDSVDDRRNLIKNFIE